MSDPAPNAAPSGAAPPSRPAEPPARWLDRVSGLLLCVAVGVALVPATPALLRALGIQLPGIASPSEGAPVVLPHRPPELLGNPDSLFDPDHDLDPDEARSPDGSDLPGAAAAAHARIGLARGPLVLHDKPTFTARSLGAVKTGEMVMIMHEAGEWVYVVSDSDEKLVSGWAKKSEIAIR